MSMPMGEIFTVSIDALRVNKLRSLLTMLGIIIGVSAVIAMLALGTGAQQAVNERISSLGTTLVTVVPGQVFTGGIASATDRARLDMEDAQALEQRGTLFHSVQPEMGRSLAVQFRATNTNTQVIGSTPNYLDVRKYTLAAGRMFDAGENEGRKRVAVVGATTANNLGLGPALVGQEIRIAGNAHEVIGVMAPKGGATGFNDPDDQIVIPINTARFRVIGRPDLRSINVVAPSEAEIPATMAEIQKIMRREHRLLPGRPDDFEIRNQADFLSTLGETTKVFTYLLAGIAAVSLLVGGIGIMNIMLVSVTERTREVGIRKALGATRNTVLMQFLIEAIVLCLLGGIIGVALGIGMAWMLKTLLNWNTTVSMSSVLLAFIFSAGIGVLFGVWPARRAASLDPIQSLRYE
jgi:putative ABC transport system permease protein